MTTTLPAPLTIRAENMKPNDYTREQALSIADDIVFAGGLDKPLPLRVAGDVLHLTGATDTALYAEVTRMLAAHLIDPQERVELLLNAFAVGRREKSGGKHRLLKFAQLCVWIAEDLVKLGFIEEAEAVLRECIEHCVKIGDFGTDGDILGTFASCREARGFSGEGAFWRALDADMDAGKVTISDFAKAWESAKKKPPKLCAHDKIKRGTGGAWTCCACGAAVEMAEKKATATAQK